MTLIILLGLATPAFADDDLVTISLVPTKTEVAQGDSFSVDVNIDKSLKNIIAYQVTLWWNSDMLTYNGSTNYVSNCATNEIGDPSKGPGKVFLNMFATVDDDANPYDITAGTLGTFHFTAKEDVTGSPDLELEIVEIYKEDFTQCTYKADNQASSLTIKEKTVTPSTPFTSITTADGEEVSYEFKGMIPAATTWAEYNDGPYYHVTIPQGTESVLVTYPADVGIAGAPSAYSYTLSVPAYELGYGNAYFTVKTNDDGSKTVTIPVASYLLTDGTGTAMSLEEEGSFDPITFFSFAYAAGGTEPEPTDPNPSEPETKGYTVTASEDKSIATGENATVTVTVGGDADTYNAYDLTLTYDTDKLTYVSGVAADEKATVDAKDGTIRVIGFGKDKNIDTAAVTLTFQGKANGEADVKITSAKVDISNKAIDSNAPEATILDDTTVITISGYTVSLGEGLSGATTVAPGADYTFTATDWNNYDYVISGKMGDNDATVIDNGDGTYTIKNVTGNLDISATMTPKSYDVTIDGEDTTGAKKATYNTAYTFTVTEQSGYNYGVTVTIGGKAYTGYTANEGTYTIPGTAITGDIVITVTKTAIPVTEYGVTVKGSGAGDVTAAGTVEAGSDLTFTLNKAEGFEYTITATMGGEEATVIDNEDGTYTIKNVSGAVVIKVDKKSDLKVEVTEYITLDEKSMYLVTVSGTIAEGSVAKYDGMAMYWSEKYNAYAWLLVSADNLETVKTTAAGKVTVAEGTAAGTVDYSGDVNGTGTVDVNDAQLTYDIYNTKYGNFDTVSMLKFLNADVNFDKTVNVEDTAAIVSVIYPKN